MQENRREWFLSPPGIVIVLCFFPTVFTLAGLYISEAFQLNGQAVGTLSGALIALVVVILYHQYLKLRSCEIRCVP